MWSPQPEGVKSNFNLEMNPTGKLKAMTCEIDKKASFLTKCLHSVIPVGV